MIKAVFFDMDGTLVAYPLGRVPDSALKAMDHLREQGILVCAATGRHRVEMETLDFLKMLSFDAVAALNGQYCYTPQEDLGSNLLSPQDMKTYVTDYNYPCILSEKRRMYVNRVTEGFRQAQEGIASTLPPQEDLCDVEQREILQLQVFCNPEEAAALDANLTAAKTVRWNPDFVDLIPKVGGKTNGIEGILNHFQITWEEVMAFGDGENDMEMLQAAKIGIAMGNAAEAVKAVADDVTADPGEDGIALALEKYLF